jgi:hypothetical protein
MERENPFKKITGVEKEVPVELRQRVINDASSAKLIMDMAHLFTQNYKAAISSMFLTEKGKQPNNN